MCKSIAFWLGCDLSKVRHILLFIALVSLIVAQPGAANGQTVNWATVQPGQTSLNLPAGGSIYIFGMGTGGAMPATNFAQGPYAQVVDVGGQVVAGLAITQRNSNSFTTDCADYTIGGVSVTGYKTVSASYAVNNQPNPTSASVSFVLAEPAVVVIFAIAGGQDHLTLAGVPSLQIDADKPNDTHGIKIAIGHASLPPGSYTATENTEGDPGRDPAHEGDLIGAFVFTGAGPPNVMHGQNATGAMVLPPLPSLSVPVHVFNGAYAAYYLNFGNISTPFTWTISDVDSVRQTYKFSTALGAGSSRALRGDIVGFDFRSFALGRSDLNLLRQGTAPKSLPEPVLPIRHSIMVSVPAGTFVTEQIGLKGGTVWVDATSGVLVKVMGREIVTSIFGTPPGIEGDNATAELTKTNVPMSVASSSSVPLYVLAIAGTVLLLMVICYAVARKSKKWAWRSAPAPEGSNYTPQPAPLPAAQLSRQPLRPPPPRPSVSLGSQATPVPTQSAAPVTIEALDKLAKLKSLLDTGLITREDFEKEKAKLLGAN
jgi:hypothetical protein